MMRDKVRRVLTRTLVSLGVALVLVSAVVAVTERWPVSHEDMTRSMAVVEIRSFYSVAADGAKPLFFGGVGNDGEIEGLSADSSVASRTVMTTGVWTDGVMLIPSCHGRLTVFDGSQDTDRACRRVEQGFARMLAYECARLRKAIAAYVHEQSEMDYYLSVHNVQDEGFTSVSLHSERVSHVCDSLKTLLAVLEQADTTRKLTVRRHVAYTLLTCDRQGKTVRQPYRRLTAGTSCGLIVIQSDTKQTPSDARPLYFHSITPYGATLGDTVLVASYTCIGEPFFSPGKAGVCLSPSIISARTDTTISCTLPRNLCPGGSPVFTLGGRLLGIMSEGKVTGVRRLHSLLRNTK